MTDERKPIRMRHEGARRRDLTVAEKVHLAPNYLSIRFTSDDLADFVSAGADDHLKFIIPGPPRPDGRPQMRDYTPRAFDLAKGEISIEFALHEDPGPATAWAIGAKVGDVVSIAGPRGSMVVPNDFDWYWLIGDETAIPAIARRMAEIPDAAVTVVIAVAGPEEEVALPQGARHSVEWVHRPATAAGDPSALLAAVSRLTLPAGEGFVWIAAEAAVAKALRAELLGRGLPPTRMRAAGYWTTGLADTTDRFE